MNAIELGTEGRDPGDELRAESAVRLNAVERELNHGDLGHDHLARTAPASEVSSAGLVPRQYGGPCRLTRRTR